MKNRELYIKGCFWMLWASIVAVCVYYIIYNAQWFVGDDAIIIRHTGFGKPFLPADTVNPQLGRFYPFSYLAYNILLLFGGDYISATAHYVLHSIFFVLFVVSVTILVLKILEVQSSVWRYIIALMVIVVFIGRAFTQYTECFSTAWCGYTILVMFMLSSIMFYKKQSWIYGIVALVCINYNCYCSEKAFVLPLSMGVCALLFQRKTLSKRERTFNWLLVGSALLFLALYAILILPNVESTYDSAHGTSVGIVENAIKMLLAQKLLLLALVLFVVRFVDVVWNKKEYCFYDNLLMTAAACCLGRFILRLNWAYYYNGVAMLTIPSILYFSIYYLKREGTLALFVLLALFYGRKIPSTIQKNQNHRCVVNKEITLLTKKMNEGMNVYWFEPETNNYSYSIMLREWRYVSMNTYLGWLRHDSDFSLKRASKFDRIDNTIWLSSIENKELFGDDSCLLKYGEVVFHADSIYGYQITSNNE